MPTSYLGLARARPLTRMSDLFSGSRVHRGLIICGSYGTAHDNRNRSDGLLPVTAAGPSLGRAHVDGAGQGPSHGRTGRGVPGVSAGPASVAEHGEVLRAGAGP